MCVDSAGLYINPAIAGVGLSYNTGVLGVCGANLAGNSISWTGNTFNVNVNSGTLSSALNSKLNGTIFNIFTGNTQTLYNNTLESTGFINNDDIKVTYNINDRTINLSAITGTIQYYWRGILHDLGTSWTSTSHTDNTLGWYLYSTDGINILWSNTGWKFSDLQVASRPSNVTFALTEVHGTMQHNTHEEFHDVVGTYIDSGFGLVTNTYSIQPTVPIDVNNTPSFEAGVIIDEDLHSNIALWNEGAYTLTYFPNNTDFTFETGSTTIFNVGSTYPTINSWDGSAFSDVEMSDGYFANWYVFRIPVTSDEHSQNYRAFIIQPQIQYESLLAAQGENVASLNLTPIKNNFAEYVPVERITLGANSTYSGATGRVRIEAEGVLLPSKFGQIGNIKGVGVSASNITISPTYQFTGTNIQSLSNEYAIAINSKLSILNFNTFTGTTLPANYHTKAVINAYTGATATAISCKANIASPTFTGTVRSVTPALNDNSTCIATTAWYINQCATATPLMNGVGDAGTSTLWTKQDHVHPSDTSRLSTTTFSTYTGTTAPSQFASKSFLSTYTGTTVPNTYLTKSSFTTYTGTTVPNTYYNKTQIDSYSGKTNTLLTQKAFLSGATFTGVLNANKPA
jgi:hypothetical protein